VPDVSSFEQPERDVLAAAIDDQYETDAVDDWLAQLVSDTAYVERNGTYYRVDAAVPTYTLAAEQVDRSDVDGAVASGDTYDEAVTYDGAVRRGLIRRASSGGYEMPYVWPSLRSLVEEYAAVEVHGDVYRLSLSTADPGPPYTVDATGVRPATSSTATSARSTRSPPSTARRFARPRSTRAPTGRTWTFPRTCSTASTRRDSSASTTATTTRTSIAPVSSRWPSRPPSSPDCRGRD
jgi:hypothetical protein